MNAVKTKLLSVIVASSLCVGMLTFSNCSDDDENEPTPTIPECPVTVECPIGMTPNPAKDCICE